ncbi:hypothetical protein EMMF5_000967 [Cystobasidiomycetes sp. EMM_F5]
MAIQKANLRDNTDELTAPMMDHPINKRIHYAIHPDTDGYYNLVITSILQPAPTVKPLLCYQAEEDRERPPTKTIRMSVQHRKYLLKPDVKVNVETGVCNILLRTPKTQDNPGNVQNTATGKVAPASQPAQNLQARQTASQVTQTNQIRQARGAAAATVPNKNIPAIPTVALSKLPLVKSRALATQLAKVSAQEIEDQRVNALAQSYEPDANKRKIEYEMEKRRKEQEQHARDVGHREERKARTHHGSWYTAGRTVLTVPNTEVSRLWATQTDFSVVAPPDHARRHSIAPRLISQRSMPQLTRRPSSASSASSALASTGISRRGSAIL